MLDPVDDNDDSDWCDAALLMPSIPLSLASDSVAVTLGETRLLITEGTFIKVGGVFKTKQLSIFDAFWSTSRRFSHSRLTNPK